MTEGVKRDPYRSKERWEKWFSKNKKKIRGISKRDSDLILEFLKDMEVGLNINPIAKKGERSCRRLNDMRVKLVFFSQNNKKSLDKLTKKDIHKFFTSMRNGELKRRDGKTYQAVGTYVKDFRCFWNWLMRTGKVEENITIDLSRKEDKPSWVYLTEPQFKKLANRCSPDYRVIAWFMYDTGMRVTEANSIQVKHFFKDYTKLTILPEISKTFGRTINLKICSSLIKEYINHHNLKSDDYLFLKHPATINMYLKRLAEKLFGTGETKARGNYNQFTLYDIRHNASCYWLRRYPKTRALMYRMGWSKEEQIKYYSEFLGLSDELSDDDMVTAEDKLKLEKEVERLKKTTISKREIGEIFKTMRTELKREIINIFDEFQDDKFTKKETKEIIQLVENG